MTSWAENHKIIVQKSKFPLKTNEKEKLLDLNYLYPPLVKKTLGRFKNKKRPNYLERRPKGATLRDVLVRKIKEKIIKLKNNA